MHTRLTAKVEFLPGGLERHLRQGPSSDITNANSNGAAVIDQDGPGHGGDGQLVPFRWPVDRADATAKILRQKLGKSLGGHRKSAPPRMASDLRFSSSRGRDLNP